jgi:hypothetical protein
MFDILKERKQFGKYVPPENSGQQLPSCVKFVLPIVACSLQFVLQSDYD